VVVTGGGGGIGGATCRRFAAEGARVAVLDRDLAAADGRRRHPSPRRARAGGVRCDITQRAEVDAAVATTVTQLGPIDVKGGLVAFSKTIAREHARHGITVNVVCPGPTDTALFADYKEGAGNPEKLMEAFTRSIPLGRIGQPDDLPGAILFFASDDAAFVTGQVLSVSGGLTMNG
jgi:NAD(P)-dependent dehydrogenase (short-subunit alcohol dehydrogenase family)